ncbi:4524_t:CDS:2 [Ambispora gerdemannii]|uniref:4524_t:CDS:1 n=1 Tax=Ambispora gerdemannii TaxID=144530 RepID=A0A9N9CP06_9GLOM|nr:4524_t:CDS:2 [Ambispora gerdemannii]
MNHARKGAEVSKDQPETRQESLTILAEHDNQTNLSSKKRKLDNENVQSKITDFHESTKAY